jgi:hypothetical protein
MSLMVGNDLCLKSKVDTVVYLTRQDHQWCMDFATRVRVKRSDEEHRTTRYNDGMVAHKIGALGEFAYFLIVGKDPRAEMRITQDVDPGYDDILYGRKVQVKSTQFSGRPAALMCEDFYLEKADFVVGMAVTGNIVRALGYLTVEEFVEKRGFNQHIAPNTKCGSVWEDSLRNIQHLRFHARYMDVWSKALTGIEYAGRNSAE